MPLQKKPGSGALLKFADGPLQNECCCGDGCPTITLDDDLPDAVVGESYSADVTASGGTAPYTYAVTSGALPSGLSLNVNDGTISGTPTTAETATFTITATDANGCDGSRTYEVIIFSCNECNPPLAETYHVVLTLADTTEVEADMTIAGTCNWIGNTGPPQNADIYLDWDGFDWTVTTAGLNPLYGVGGECSPTGNYSNDDGDTAVVS